MREMNKKYRANQLRDTNICACIRVCVSFVMTSRIAVSLDIAYSNECQNSSIYYSNFFKLIHYEFHIKFIGTTRDCSHLAQFIVNIGHYQRYRPVKVGVEIAVPHHHIVDQYHHLACQNVQNAAPTNKPILRTAQCAMSMYVLVVGPSSTIG